MKRKFSLTLETEAGTINMFYAFLNGNRIIADDGTELEIGREFAKRKSE